MSYHLDATENFFHAIDSVDILIDFARKENNEGRIKNHDLFLNLSVVSLVTKFQVFVENSLEEFLYKIQRSNKTYQDLPLTLRLSSLKHLLDSSNILPNKLEHPQRYNQQILQQVRSEFQRFNRICSDDARIDNEFKFNTKFPMGKQGVNELIELYKQINGENIFELSSLDKNKLNEILRRRHDIVHDDVNHQLNELKVTEYKIFIEKVVKCIDNYLRQRA
ncbi:MAG: hypothetical protein DRR08_05535 [Candidatus Parabeggiatoa sp. nov. 2]|nr:MAG: hypothetical protein B6247_01275 [Beggiatoa sp. 4572_84]RKZ62621.1 MAG: hypothetical protein DRR08_05535 [Gammaproteobacteria bacterium]